MQKLIDRIDGLLAKREKVYPVQDQTYHQLLQACELLTERLLEYSKEQKRGWAPDVQLVEKTRTFIEHPIFVCGAMKTGTTLLTRLLDNHPSLMVMPGDSHYYTNFREFQGSHHDLSIYWMQRLINPSGQAPFWFLGKAMQRYADFLLYLEYFLKTNDDTFQAVVAATFCANPNRSMATRHWVEKKPENERYVHWFIKRYPAAKFVHLVRDPLINISSIKRLSHFKNIPFRAISYSVRLKHLMRLGPQNAIQFGRDVYQVIKYEDLITSTDQQMSELAGFLDIDFLDTLLVPSENGIPARANSMYQEDRVTGDVSVAGINEKWKFVLTKSEQEQIITVLLPLSISLGYSHWSDEAVAKFRKPYSAKYLLIKSVEKLFDIKYQRQITRGK